MKHLAILAVIVATMFSTGWATQALACDNSTPHNCE